MEEKETFMSVEIGAISTAVSAFQGEIEQPSLNRENPYFKSRYVDLSGVLKSVQKLLAKNGLAVMQIISGNDIITLLTHKSGQWFKSVCPIGNYKSQQDRGSAITYTKRYALCAILGIAADTDDDGNAATDADNKKNAKTVQQPMQGNEALLAQALKELNDCKNYQQYGDLWVKWSNTAPELCNPNSTFYKACQQKAKEFDI
ncbi:MAG: ERF family protein [Bacteroidales bacterium]|nr:ERF family protein [Bacteroidales bacterium]